MRLLSPVSGVLLVLSLALTLAAHAQPVANEPPGEEPPEAKPAQKVPVSVGAYVEAFYQWNFNDPSNGITNYRGFDNRHDSFTLSNVAIDAQSTDDRLIARLTLQVGHTPSTYYGAEPSLPGASGANATNAELWKYVQQAYGGYRFASLHDLTVSAGVFLSPIGPETMPVHENWNWSRSNLFFGLPFYHTGARAALPLSEAWTVTLAVYNGWNSVVDDNREKSLSAQLTFTDAKLSWSLLYFGGVERPKGAPEGRAFRHLFDSYATWTIREWLSVIAHGNGGFEPNDFGTSYWVAGALSGRVRLLSPLHLALRGDTFGEHVASSSAGRATPIFWPASWVASATGTLDYRPHDHISFRLEYRHDHAQRDMYFGGTVTGDGRLVPYVVNRRSQDTLTAGMTAWY